MESAGLEEEQGPSTSPKTVPAIVPTGSATTYRRAPSERELLILVLLSAAVMWMTLFALHRSTHEILNAGDNAAYLQVAEGIVHWDFHDVPIQQFMGYSYFIAGLLLFHLPPLLSLWLIAFGASLVSAWLAARMFGTWVGAYFVLTNFAWFQLSFLGGSEPLCVALGLGALLAFRKNRIFVAALLGGLSVTVRPLMIFALVGIGLVLLWRKQMREFFIALGTGLAIGGLYILPLTLYFGDPLLTVHSYTSRDYGAAKIVGPHGHLFGWPLHGIIAGTIAYPAPWTNLILGFFWIGLVLAGAIMMFSGKFREYGKKYPAEAIFCGFYLLALFCYDYLIWARGSFMRFSIPVLPFVFLALIRFLPKDRRLFWVLSIGTPILSAVSEVGVKNVLR